MNRLMLLFLLTGLTIFSNAQQTISPGDKIIHYDWIQPGHSYYRNIISDTSGNAIYDFMMEDYLLVDRQRGQITFARNRQVPAGFFEADTSVTDLNLKPLTMHEVHTPQQVSFEMDFTDTLATVTTHRKTGTTDKRYPMRKGYFEDNMIEYIFGYLQLQKGILYTLDNFNKDTPAPSDPYTLEYAFEDTWNLAPDHCLTCTVLHFTHGATSGYIWIDQRTHLMIKTIAHFKTGSYVLTKI